MVQVDRLAGYIVSPLAVDLAEAVDLVPEVGLIDTEVLEEGGLHVPGDQSLVKVPDAGDDVLSEEYGGHSDRRSPVGQLPHRTV